MNSVIETQPPTQERLKGESSRAYAAFCRYRDLGPERSFDRAWKRFCADQGKDRGSGRRPGHWAAWSTKFNWVERAEEHDDLVDMARRSAEAEQRRKLQERHSRFEVEEQDRIENRVRNMDSALDRTGAAPFTEVIQQTHDKVTGKKTTTKVKPPNLRDMAALMKETNETARQAIQGHDIKGVEDKREVSRIVWMKSKDRSPAMKAQRESGQRNPQPIANLNLHLADPETDKAA